MREGADSTAALLRRALVALVVLGVIGVGVELVLLRHWKDPLQLIAFGGLLTLALALLGLRTRTSARAIRAVRALATVGLIVGTLGLGVHAWANYDAAPLDARVSQTWDATSEPVRWLLALTDSVGPAPTMAPAALSFVALALLAATIRHPALDTAEVAAS